MVKIPESFGRGIYMKRVLRAPKQTACLTLIQGGDFPGRGNSDRSDPSAPWPGRADPEPPLADPACRTSEQDLAASFSEEEQSTEFYSSSCFAKLPQILISRTHSIPSLHRTCSMTPLTFGMQQKSQTLFWEFWGWMISWRSWDDAWLQHQ